MKKIYLVIFLGAFAAAGARADGVDALRSALQAYQSNGADALARALFNSRDLGQAEAVRQRVEKAAAGLGEVVDTEVFAPKLLGKHVQHLYGAIYFTGHPLWVRAEYYTINGRSGFLSIEVSRNSEDILPLEIGVAPR